MKAVNLDVSARFARCASRTLRPLYATALAAMGVAACGGRGPSVTPNVDGGEPTVSIEAGRGQEPSVTPPNVDGGEPSVSTEAGLAPSDCALEVTGAYVLPTTAGMANAFPDFAECAVQYEGIYIAFADPFSPSVGKSSNAFGSLQVAPIPEAGLDSTFTDGTNFVFPSSPEAGEGCKFDNTVAVRQDQGAPFIATFTCSGLTAPDGRTVSVTGSFHTTLGPAPQ